MTEALDNMQWCFYWIYFSLLGFCFVASVFYGLKDAFVIILVFGGFFVASIACWQ